MLMFCDTEEVMAANLGSDGSLSSGWANLFPPVCSSVKCLRRELRRLDTWNSVGVRGLQGARLIDLPPQEGVSFALPLRPDGSSKAQTPSSCPGPVLWLP